MMKYFFFGKVFNPEVDEKKERRITRSKSFVLTGGDKDEHEKATEKLIKIEEKTKGKDLPPEAVQDIVQEVLES